MAPEVMVRFHNGGPLMEKVMISADTARKISVNTTNNEIMNFLDSKIKELAEQGKRSCFCGLPEDKFNEIVKYKVSNTKYYTPDVEKYYDILVYGMLNNTLQVAELRKNLETLGYVITKLNTSYEKPFGILIEW